MRGSSVLPFAVGLCAGYAVFSIAALHREAATRDACGAGGRSNGVGATSDAARARVVRLRLLEPREGPLGLGRAPLLEQGEPEVVERRAYQARR